MRTSSESSEEYIRTTETKTRSGRISRPVVQKSKVAKVKVKSSKDPEVDSNFKMSRDGSDDDGGGPSRRYLVEADLDRIIQNALLKTQLQNISGKQNTTVISSDSLPKFRGRRRPKDPPFEETNTFSNHVAMLKAYFNTAGVTDEEEKKQLLVRSADPNVGDFHVSVTKVVNGPVSKNHSFDQVVTNLDNIYISSSEKSTYSQIKSLLNYELIDNDQVGNQLVHVLDMLNSISDNMSSELGLAFVDNFPVQGALETNLQFRARTKEFINDVKTTFGFFTIIGPQLNEDVVKALQRDMSQVDFDVKSHLFEKYYSIVEQCQQTKN